MIIILLFLFEFGFFTYLEKIGERRMCFDQRVVDTILQE